VEINLFLTDGATPINTYPYPTHMFPEAERVVGLLIKDRMVQQRKNGEFLPSSSFY